MIARDSKLGITLAARSLGTVADATIIELRALCDREFNSASQQTDRRVRGIGQSVLGHRFGPNRLVLRDDRGHEYVEEGRGAISESGDSYRETLSFLGLRPSARSGVIEVGHVWVVEVSDEVVTVAVPGETNIHIAGCEARVTVTRVAGVYASGSARLEFEPRDPDADRQLVYVELIDPDPPARPGGRLSHEFGRRPIVEAPELTHVTHELRLRHPVIQLHGPWRLEISLSTN